MKPVKVSAALNLLAYHGFTDDLLSSTLDGQDKLVTIHQCWQNDGREYAELRLARGKYRGNWAGSVRRAKNYDPATFRP